MSRSSPPPTREEINVFDSLDERVACEHFLGKDLSQAEALFRENGALHQEDLMWMGPVAFAYYLPAACRYLASRAADEDAHFAQCMMHVIDFHRGEPAFALAQAAARELLETIRDHAGRLGGDDDERAALRVEATRRLAGFP